MLTTYCEVQQTSVGGRSPVGNFFVCLSFRSVIVTFHTSKTSFHLGSGKLGPNVILTPKHRWKHHNLACVLVFRRNLSSVLSPHSVLIPSGWLIVGLLLWSSTLQDSIFLPSHTPACPLSFPSSHRQRNHEDIHTSPGKKDVS